MILTALFATLTVVRPSAMDISSHFETGNDGWSVVGLPENGSYAQPNAGPTASTFSTPGGNPGGHIAFLDTEGFETFYFDAPARFIGNQSSSYGLRLLYDMRTSGGNEEWIDADVVLVGTNGLVLLADSGPNPTGSWVTRSVSLSESGGWHLGTLSGPVPTRGEFFAVLSGLSALRIRGEFSYGDDTGYLDNVVLESGRIDTAIRVSQVEVCWNSVPGRNYQVQWRTDIEASIWTNLGTPVLGTGDRVCGTDQVSDGQPGRFYRIVELP